MDVDPLVRNRALAGAAVLAVVVLGGYQSGAVARGTEAKVAQLREKEVSAQDAQRMALARDLTFKKQQGYFEAELEADFKAFGLTPISMDQLKAPNVFVHALQSPITLSAGRTWSSEHLKIRASIEKVNFQKSGARVLARHSVATVTNKSSKPVAYHMRVRSAKRGHCKVRGARVHNAMALRPGESAEVVVCAGTGAIKVEDVRVLEVTPLGALYVSKVPPVAVGHDAVTSRVHQPFGKHEKCSKVPAVKITNWIKVGRMKWEDVVDFYSRHNCERVQVHADYRLATEPLDTLPAVPGAAKGTAEAADAEGEAKAAAEGPAGG